MADREQGYYWVRSIRDPEIQENAQVGYWTGDEWSLTLDDGFTEDDGVVVLSGRIEPPQ